MRDKINEALKESLKAKETLKVSTLRLILAATKDREIALRGEDKTLTQDDILQIMQKMIRQRQESAETYEAAGRTDLSTQEREEIKIIETFLPVQMSDEEIQSACKKTVSDIEAAGLKDMGRVMNTLKDRYTGQMDFKKASAEIKSLLQ
ncbi:MAG: GatB/YqeY domain-containing protein [Alphaproteobacteria bacterium]|nr:GatB/YqeY domain-containing protein [Alphaproteobacteria bacterium]